MGIKNKKVNPQKPQRPQKKLTSFTVFDHKRIWGGKKVIRNSIFFFFYERLGDSNWLT